MKFKHKTTKSNFNTVQRRWISTISDQINRQMGQPENTAFTDIVGWQGHNNSCKSSITQILLLHVTNVAISAKCLNISTAQAMNMNCIVCYKYGTFNIILLWCNSRTSTDMHSITLYKDKIWKRMWKTACQDLAHYISRQKHKMLCNFLTCGSSILISHYYTMQVKKRQYTFLMLWPNVDWFSKFFY